MEMSEQAVRDWRLQGSIRLYRAKHWRGQAWHLEGDDAGFATLVELLRLLQDAEFPILRTLTVSGPPVGADLRLYSKYRYAKTWKIDFVRSATEPHWEWSGDTDHPVLHLGNELLAEFIECLTDERCEDFGIGRKHKKCSNITDLPEAELWFWRTMRPA
jgi:hypothetical protein